MLTPRDQQKIDLGEETGPRTVCSGLVAYMSEEQIKDQTVVVVVSRAHMPGGWRGNTPPESLMDCVNRFPTVQPQAGDDAWRQILCHASLRKRSRNTPALRTRASDRQLSPFTSQATSPDGKDAGIEFVRPPPGSKAGDRIYFEGEKYESRSSSSARTAMDRVTDRRSVIRLRCDPRGSPQPEKEGV
jgi:aminoacyl tRNA synthase complex-interacting multifunctional protein 1